jgi:predicted site-specific integrase-resolvase
VAKRVWTVAEVRGLGTVTDIETAASVLGIGRTTAYRLAKAKSFPVPVLRVGHRYVVAVENLLKALGATDNANSAA